MTYRQKWGLVLGATVLVSLIGFAVIGAVCLKYELDGGRRLESRPVVDLAWEWIHYMAVTGLTLAVIERAIAVGAWFDRRKTSASGDSKDDEERTVRPRPPGFW